MKCLTRLAGLLIGATCSVGMAQQRTQAVDVAARSTLPDVEINLDLRKLQVRAGGQRSTQPVTDGDQIKTGEDIVVCFKASSAGYVTLWSIDAGGDFALVYPNAFSHAGSDARAESVAAGEEQCVGESDKFLLRAQPPLGRSKVYLYWTRTEDEQLAVDDYPSIGRSVSRGAETYAAETIEFEIVQ